MVINMKIYEIGTGYTPIPAQVAAATESVVEELTKAFINMNQPVEIIDISTNARAATNLPITEAKVPGIFTRSDVSLGIVHKLKRVVYSIALAFKLKKVLKNETEKVVLHFHNQYNLFFFDKLVCNKLRKKALIAYTNHNGMWSLEWQEVKDVLQKRYFQEIEAMRNADLIFALNDGMQKNIIKHLGINLDKVKTIANGVNTKLYYPLEAEQIQVVKQQYNLSGKKVILQVGSINENKGQERAVRLLAPLLKSDRSLVYAYAGGVVSAEYHTVVQNAAKELGVEDSVIYLGAVSPGKQMNELYNMADTTVFLSKYEGFPLVCIESLSAGVPVVLCSNSVSSLGEGCTQSAPDTLKDDIPAVISNLDSEKAAARNTAQSQYVWSKIATDYKTAFEANI